MIFLLDACSIINLLHIDEDEFLLKKLSEFQFKICPKVFEETRRNVYKKFTKTIPYPLDQQKLIENKLNYFRERIHSDVTYLELVEPVSFITGYHKNNGEFLSVTLSFYLNTFDRRYIWFITDDCPAKAHFAPFMGHHKIGYIEDTVDLLIFLYRQCDGFSTNDLKRLLSGLYYEYAYEISNLEKNLNSVYIPKHLLKNQDITFNLQKLKAALRNFALDEVWEIYQLVINDCKRYQFLHDILEPYFYYLNKNVSNEYLKKIQENIAFIKTKPFYKFGTN